jgi:DDE family transposase
MSARRHMGRRPGRHPSSVKPTLGVTRWCATFPSDTPPRTSTTSNHLMFRTVSGDRPEPGGRTELEERGGCGQPGSRPRQLLVGRRAKPTGPQVLDGPRVNPASALWRDPAPASPYSKAPRRAIDATRRTHAQAIRRCGLRRCRYIGLAKTHLQHVITAAVVNLVRVAEWFAGTPVAETRCSRFAALRPAA